MLVTRRLISAPAARLAACLPVRALSGGSAEFGMYPNDTKVEYVTDMEFLEPDDETYPAYQVMGKDGKPRKGAKVPKLGKEKNLEMYKAMVQVGVMDQVLYDAQRQGRISFYMTAGGEEATHIGSAAALSPEDQIYSQYREAGVLMWRGFSLQQVTDQCFSNVDDVGKGRQMPVHYGSAELNFQTISSPLATQLPQASGMAYAMKLAGEQRCTVCYFGEGAASEGDFHPALNFATTREAPVIFFVRNNGYAISTPVIDQYRGDGIVARGVAYGMHSLRVDGNDVFAVYNAVKEARRIAVEESKPVLLEAMTYRLGHHSTSDDSTRYREAEEIQSWMDSDHPVTRYRKYLEHKKWWSAEEDETLRKDLRAAVLDALNAAETKKKPAVRHLFTDVYDKPTKALLEQEEHLNAHLAKHGDKYALDMYASD
eukprot:PLAT13191.1.p2 GENE.PLAT13191.1~~PLAT13191.1.p2  ORF type:complete len:466 (+),score=200.00 PLAT13191.1:118-1398(+)